MAKISKSLTELIGKTPLLELSNYEKKNNLKAKIIAKLEYFNPGGSVKDRIALAMIDDAEKSGKLKAGSVIIENVFFLPGLGRLVFQAVTGRDLIVVQAVVVLLAGAVVMLSFLIEMIYAIADPRLRRRVAG